MEKYTLYLGLNDKDKKIQLINTLECYKIATNILMQYTSGATIFEANGIYKHDNGEFVVEKTLRIELLFVTEKQVQEIVKQLKVVFNQESVAVQKETVNSQLM